EQNLRAADNVIESVKPEPQLIGVSQAANSFMLQPDTRRDSVLRLEQEADDRALREEIRPGALEMINAAVMGATDQQILQGLRKRLFADDAPTDPNYKPDLQALVDEAPGMDRDMLE